MNIPNYLISGLNDAQISAVTADNLSVMVLAGAGTGKTRVLIHRIAYQIQVNHLKPYEILAVTFTNRAAKEMKHRIHDLLKVQTKKIVVGTFHGICFKFLRKHYLEANLDQKFQLIDSGDQLAIIKRLLKDLGLASSFIEPDDVQSFINDKKDKGLRAKDVEVENTLLLVTKRDVYFQYEEFCNRSNLVDFSELLLRTFETLVNNSMLLNFYKNKFKAIHVDEFQDTNELQYRLVTLISNLNNLFVVGDDDQSIYSWRGAQVENMMQFRSDYSTHILIKLEQNYRSSSVILNAANALISNNQNRIGKTLWTESNSGSHIDLFLSADEQDEAIYVVNQIKALVALGYSYNDFAILYRQNALSRIFEQFLIMANVPYVVFGGLRFYDRAEVKNALAYIQLVYNRDNDLAFQRVVNLPSRGIGDKTLEKIKEFAKLKNISFFKATESMILSGYFSKLTKQNEGLTQFLELIQSLDFSTQKLSLPLQIQAIIEHSGLIQMYQKKDAKEFKQRKSNLDELVNAAAIYSVNESDNLGDFLINAVLDSSDKQSLSDNCVKLMTIHTSKGLEFKRVFLVGLEDDIFPMYHLHTDDLGIEEERRLCYVAITRAREKLTFSCVRQRFLYGHSTITRKSRFLAEVLEAMPRHSFLQIKH